MELDEAFRIAVKKFYDGSSHKNVDKYSKRPFEYSFSGLDEMQKKFTQALGGETIPQEEPMIPEEDTGEIE